MASHENKIHKPTVRQLRQTAEAGIFPYSTDLAIAVTLMTGCLVTAWYADKLLFQMIDLLRILFTTGLQNPNSGTETLLGLPWLVTKLVAPVGLTIFGVTLAIAWVQSPRVMRKDLIADSMGDWIPGRRLFDLFSMKTPGRLLFQILKIGVITAIAFFGYEKIVGRIEIAQMNTSAITHGDTLGIILVGIILVTLLQICMALVVFALIDKIYRHKQWWDSVCMTPEELKREKREAHGDPRLRKRRSSEHRSLMNRFANSKSTLKDTHERSSR